MNLASRVNWASMGGWELERRTERGARERGGKREGGKREGAREGGQERGGKRERGARERGGKWTKIEHGRNGRVM